MGELITVADSQDCALGLYAADGEILDEQAAASGMLR